MRERGAAWRGRVFAAVLFDLDGTLIDTAGDIAQALNATLRDFGHAPLDAGTVRNLIGRGSPVLIERALALRGAAAAQAVQAAMLERFFHYYEGLEQAARSSALPFDGALGMLGAVHAAGLRTAIVTNKHHRFAVSLLSRLRMAELIDVVIGGDSCARRKPDPQPLLIACERLGVEPAATLMVGDSINDVTAARAARMPIACVSYGYNEGRPASSLDCDVLIDSLRELPPLLLATAAALP